MPVTRQSTSTEMAQSNIDQMLEKLTNIISTSESHVTARIEGFENNMKQYINDTVFGYIDNIVKHIVPSSTAIIATQTPVLTHPQLNQSNTDTDHEEDASHISTSNDERHQQPTGRLRTAQSNKRVRHDVYIGNMALNTTEDDVRAHLMDIGVVDIVTIARLTEEDPPTSISFRVGIDDATIKQNVFKTANFDSGIIVKPFRFYKPNALIAPQQTVKQPGLTRYQPEPNTRQKPHNRRVMPRNKYQDTRTDMNIPTRRSNNYIRPTSSPHPHTTPLYQHNSIYAQQPDMSHRQVPPQYQDTAYGYSYNQQPETRTDRSNYHHLQQHDRQCDPSSHQHPMYYYPMQPGSYAQAVQQPAQTPRLINQSTNQVENTMYNQQPNRSYIAQPSNITQRPA